MMKCIWVLAGAAAFVWVLTRDDAQSVLQRDAMGSANERAREVEELTAPAVEKDR